MGAEWIFRPPDGTLIVWWQEAVGVVDVEHRRHVKRDVGDGSADRIERYECRNGRDRVSGNRLAQLAGPEVAVAGVIDGRQRERCQESHRPYGDLAAQAPKQRSVGKGREEARIGNDDRSSPSANPDTTPRQATAPISVMPQVF